VKNLKDKIVAITGAASGIGRSLALNLADEGCHLAISDINETGLKETADMVCSRSKNLRITTHKVDTSDHKQVKQYADDVVKAHGEVHIIINNAGVVITETIEDLSYEDFEWLMGINLWGVIYGCKEFLPYLKKQDSAHIINISSVNGIFTNPNNGPYCTAKFAVQGIHRNTGTGTLPIPKSKYPASTPAGLKPTLPTTAGSIKLRTPHLNGKKPLAVFNRVFAKTTADKAATDNHRRYQKG
jgi:NAD(P)-dependent dehydrogenase (short-subunit alcohol dehydrogenase family)